MVHRKRLGFVSLLLAAAAGCAGGPAKPKDEVAMKEELPPPAPKPADADEVLERAAVPVESTWRLADLFPDEQAWEKAFAELAQAVPGLAEWEGRLGEAPETLRALLDEVDGLGERFSRLYAYASFRRDLDTRDNQARALVERMRSLGLQFGQATAWIEPEILSLPAAELEALRRHPALKLYHHRLDNLVRLKKHVLDKDQEALLAKLGRVVGAPGSIYNTFADTEFPNPKIRLSDGREVELTKPMYTKYRASTNREDRLKTFRAFWGAYMAFKNTFAGTLSAAMDGSNFGRRARKYDSCLDAAIYDDNLPVALYSNLIERVHAALPAFHRYLALRRELLGVEELGYHDIYAPIIAPAQLRYTWDDARRLVLEAVAPLGADYTGVLERGLAAEGRWVDVMPTRAKRSGAYSAGVYGVHPFVLLNFVEDYNSVSTLAHELGHSMHSHLANQAQPHATAGYAIFVAEVASTFNEALLTDLMLKRAADDRERLYILGEWLDNYRQTVFRQAMFAEFEWLAHQMVEQGQPITADALNALYLKLLRLYHGHDQKVMAIDELYAIEWAYIPHFYRNFYVFTYCTGLISSTALAEKVLAEGEPARKAYLEALAKGGADYPLEILKHAGVDLLSPEPFVAANAVFERRLAEAEEIVRRLQAKGGR